MRECAAEQGQIVAKDRGAQEEQQQIVAKDRGTCKCMAKQQQNVAKDRGQHERAANSNYGQVSKQRECPCATNGCTAKKQQSNRGCMNLINGSPLKDDGQETVSLRLI
jgi:hypothetical protein